ncbi:alpha/beta fold hydrolase [Hyphomicrobium sp.]|uniref:alpha/beta fold hydrolase n=1 Tax=Hyphomicrobium sp. TaxID=82 RepID=UPI002FDF27EF
MSQRKFVAIPSGRIAYEEQGAGPVALFVHGVIVNSYLWRHQLAELSAIRRCIAVDLMAHGASEIAPQQDVSFDAQAQMLLDVLDALGIDMVDLVANDSGTGIAQIFAANHPERLRSLTLTNGDVHDNWPPKDFSGFLDMVANGGLAATLRGMADDKALFRGPDGLGGAYEHPQAVTDATIDAYLTPYLANPARLHDLERFILAFDNVQTLRIKGKLEVLTVPTLIVWGTGDIFFGAEWSRWLADTIPGTLRRVEVPGGRLFLPDERASEVNSAILQFWSETS